MELQDCIVFLLAKNSQAGYRFWGNYISHMNVTTVQAMVLILLHKKDGVPSREIGEQTQLDSATITGILDRLSAMGLIERHRNPEDRRGILVFLTEKGREKASVLDELFEKAHNEFLSGFTPEEETIFRGLLKRLRTQHGNL